VGDPFKDTSGPSMNILIKLMSIVSLVLAPTLAKMDINKNSGAKKQIISKSIEMKVVETNNNATATANTLTISADPKVLIETLTKDGVLKSTDKVSIEVNNGKIIINGQALTDEQNAKYSGLIQKK
jgi:K(+)-stimulated pyrophosphate-energized sodium pump